MSPIELFNSWYNEELNLSKARIPSACCLSTVGVDGFPNARYVSLKDLVDEKFIITGAITSRKGIEISGNEKVALTFWWPMTERQVRIQGTAKRIKEMEADRYFNTRSIESQIVSIVSNQGKPLGDRLELEKRYHDFDSDSRTSKLKRPDSWGGYALDPMRMEFLEFRPSRFHIRTLFEFENDSWKHTRLQP